MSYFPTPEAAQAVLNQLTVPLTGDEPFSERILASQFPRYRWDVLREVLLAIICPIVCVGVVKGEGWHSVCEVAADKTISELRKLPVA